MRLCARRRPLRLAAPLQDTSDDPAARAGAGGGSRREALRTTGLAKPRGLPPPVRVALPFAPGAAEMAAAAEVAGAAEAPGAGFAPGGAGARAAAMSASGSPAGARTAS